MTPARDLAERVRGYLSDDWAARRWAWARKPWQINAFFIAVDVAPWMPSAVCANALDAMHEQLTPLGRLREPELGNAFGAPAPIRALRLAYAMVRLAGDRAPDDERHRRLCDWLVRLDWSTAQLRPCDMTFLARIVAQGAGQ